MLFLLLLAIKDFRTIDNHFAMVNYLLVGSLDTGKQAKHTYIWNIIIPYNLKFCHSLSSSNHGFQTTFHIITIMDMAILEKKDIFHHSSLPLGLESGHQELQIGNWGQWFRCSGVEWFFGPWPLEIQSQEDFQSLDLWMNLLSSKTLLHTFLTTFKSNLLGLSKISAY